MITIAINEKTKAGKVLLATAKILAEKNSGIEFIHEEDDTELLQQMLVARNSGLVDKTQILVSLDEIISK